ncbi:MAG: type III-A CRISPR-associated protein Cas10/Csm1, partial [candidate division WOR-3 bacterium]|nr:type III-A CRISPR-associated protein Cas10/Csm1 [candidate division WOR-3 bacterium]
MNDTNEFQTLILAALLHDIGKFWQRTSEPLSEEDKRIMPNCCPFYNNNFTHLHVLYSGRFIREVFQNRFPKAENIVLYHHLYPLPKTVSEDFRYLTKIIQLADWLSSGERRGKEEEEIGNPKKDPLVNIFSMLSIDGKPTIEQYTPLTSLTLNLENLFPKKEKTEAIKEDSYLKLWQEFKKEIELLSTKNLSNIFLTQLLYLLQKFTLTVPATTYQDRPDLSLYHHLKTTAAIASSLWMIDIKEEKIDEVLKAICNQEEEKLKDAPCILLSGDLSGIQDFIYSITSEGALKGLKGRSFYLQLLIESIAKSILKMFNLLEFNIIFAAGGNFSLLLPNAADAKDKIEKMKYLFDENLLIAHRGRLSLNLVYREVRYKDFLGTNFGKLWQEIKKDLLKEKRRKFSSLFSKQNKIWEILGPFEEGGERPVCQICGEEMDSDENQCSLCRSFEDLAYDLPRARVMLVKEREPQLIKKRAKNWEELLEAVGVKFLFLPETAEKENAYLLNATDFLSERNHYLGFRFLAQNAPMIGNNVKTLEEIANTSEGIKRWAVLRADVDNLGKVFSIGLGEEDRTISRISMLSEMLSLFFNAQVEKIAREDKFKDNLYVIYSGGDDLFVIGSWSILTDFAKRLYIDFRKFTGETLTLSASIYIAPTKKFPVYQSADSAKEDLDLAKQGEKNKLTFLGKPIPWEHLYDLEKIKEKILILLDEEGPNLPRSLLQILYSGWLEKEKVERGETPIIRIWRFLYAIK